jgi:hypothetical protein
VCAMTVYAARNAELVSRYRNNKKSKESNFETQFNAVWHLLGTKRLSRHNVILCGKFINEMADVWISEGQLEMIDQLRERQERAWRRWEKRIEEREAQKAAGPYSGRKKTKNQSSTPATAPTVDPWEL